MTLEEFKKEVQQGIYEHSGKNCCAFCGSSYEVILFVNKHSSDWDYLVCEECFKGEK